MPDLSRLGYALARKYGKSPRDEHGAPWMWDELSRFVVFYLACDTDEELGRIYDAISLSCKQTDGYPDVAAVKQAIWRYEQEGRGKVTHGAAMAHPEPVDPGERSEYGDKIKAQAAAAGVDTSREGWLVRYVFQLQGGAT